jgi:glycine/D-amino acid oxidase-like deaminating enzyme
MRSIGMNCAFVEQVAGIQSNGGIEIKAQAKIHPLRFLEAVAMRAAQSTRIYEKSEVIAVHEISEGIRLTTGHGEVVAQKVLMATHYPLDPQPPQLRFKKAWYNTYVIAADIESGAIPEGLYEDLGNPYHYIRIDRGDSGDHIMVGGEDHRSDVPLDKEKAFAALERFLRQFLSNAHYTITHQWYGRVVEPGDGIAYIGPIGRIFYATGYSGNGMTYGIIAAQSFAAFCRDEPPPYPEYAASRSVRLSDYLPKALDYMEEFFGGLVRRTLRG